MGCFDLITVLLLLDFCVGMYVMVIGVPVIRVDDPPLIKVSLVRTSCSHYFYYCLYQSITSVFYGCGGFL